MSRMEIAEKTAKAGPAKPSDYKSAVVIRNARKTYHTGMRKNLVLRDMNMTVPRGTIYGLLGPSGGGKTTLLTTIIGKIHLDSGQVLVLGRKPGSRNSGIPGVKLGYMPQDIALHGNFTLKGTFKYFGWVYGMTRAEIDEKVAFLLEFLGLPNMQEKLVKNLSGGQKRRLSFAISIMHDPELIILDEPTVGVDPLLRSQIWQHLVTMTSTHRQTVIITTHYIEEARSAHTIALIREGILLAEDSPDTLLARHKSQSLNAVFLKLTTSPDALASVELPKPLADDEISLSTVSKREHCQITSKGKLKALFMKNFRLLFTNISLMLFIFLLPLVQISLFCLTIGRNFTDLKVAIVNYEVNLTEPRVCPIDWTCGGDYLSCLFINSLSNESIDKMYYSNFKSGKEAITHGKTQGLIFISYDFGEAIKNRLLTHMVTTDSEIQVWMDMTNQQVAFTIKTAIQEAVILMAKTALILCNAQPRMADIPIKFDHPVMGNYKFTFREFVSPGVVVVLIYFSALSLTATDLIVEKREGTLERDWVAGVKYYEVITFQAIVKIIIILIQIAVTLICLFGFFDVQNLGNWFLIVLLCLLQGLGGYSFGFLIAAICKSERNAINVALGSFFPLVLLSGVLWPLEGLNVGLRYFSFCLPNTYAVLAMRNMITRGWDLSNSEVYIGFLVSIAWILVFSFASVIVLTRKNR